MPDLANLDQAMRDILLRVRKANPDLSDRAITHLAMKEAYQYGMSAEGLARQFIKGGE